MLKASFAAGLTNDDKEYDIEVQAWQYHIAGLGTLLTWVINMSMIGSIPSVGMNFQMLVTASFSFIKFAATLSSLLLGFAFSLSVFFPSEAAFENYFNFGAPLVKTLVMMTGELDYNNLYYRPNETITALNENTNAINVAAQSLMFPVTAHIMLACFIIFVSIIMMNLLVGIAISDVQQIQKLGHLNLLVQQVKVMDLVDKNLAIVGHLLPWCKVFKKRLFRLERYYCLDFDVPYNKSAARTAIFWSYKCADGCLYAGDGTETVKPKAHYYVPRTLNALTLAKFARSYK